MSRLLAIASIITLTALTTACALAPYGASDGRGPGYTDRKLDDGRYALVFYGANQAPGGAWAGRSRERQLRQNVFRRAEELCASPLYTLDGFKSGMATRSAGKVAPTLSATVTCSDAKP